MTRARGIMQQGGAAVLLHSRGSGRSLARRAMRPAPDKDNAMFRHARFNALVGATAVVLALAPAAGAQVPLRDNEHINTQLLAAAVGDKIRKTCPTISARMFTVLRKARALESYAREQGYSEDEVEAFLDSPKEKARIRGKAAEYMAARGVVEGDAESYCRLGRNEIAKGSLIGSLLKE